MNQKARAVKVHTLGPNVSIQQLVERFRNEPYLCFLESCGEVSHLSRYSFLFTRPYLVFFSKGNQCFAGPPDNIEKLLGLPLEELSIMLNRGETADCNSIDSLPFLDGAVGYLGYEMLYQIESIPNRRQDVSEIPDSYLLFCNVIFMTDKCTDKTSLVVNSFADTLSEAERQAEQTLTCLLELIAPILDTKYHRGGVLPTNTWVEFTEQNLADVGIKGVMNRAAYLNAVNHAKEYICSGDVYEVCLTNRFDFLENTSVSGEWLHTILRHINPAPFSAYLRFHDLEIISSSPESLLRIERDGLVKTRPIKGTRPRGRNPREDDLLFRELSSSGKDKAENIMIVDLARNDLGKICEFGSVSVPQLMVVETHPFVHQLVSTVTGKLRKDISIIDAIRAVFPGGSMTGAPKIEAMKIIQLLEPVERGIYSGSIGYIGFDGSLNLNIVIRTIIKKGPNINFHAGGAIVWDSIPEQEYEEILHKARALIVAILAACKAN